jgi:hypothetical protein
MAEEKQSDEPALPPASPIFHSASESYEVIRSWSTALSNKSEIHPDYSRALYPPYVATIGHLKHSFLTQDSLTGILVQIDELVAEVVGLDPSDREYWADASNRTQILKNIAEKTELASSILSFQGIAHCVGEWRAVYMFKSLYILWRKCDIAFLEVLISHVSKAAAYCKARQKAAAREIFEAAASLHQANVQKLRELENNEAASELEKAQNCIREYVMKFIEDYKLAVFRTVFLEPAKCFWNACNEISRQDDVELHAVSVYAAVLGASTGIAIPIPDIGDDLCSLGLLEFFSCAYETGFMDMIKKHLWRTKGEGSKSEVVGRSYASIPELRSFKIAERFISQGLMIKEKFIFNPTTTPFAMAQKVSADASRTDGGRRIMFVPYLEAFGSFLVKDVVLEKLSSQLAQDRDKELKILFQSLKPELPNADDLDDDPRFWIWNVDDGTFSVENADKLLAFLKLFDVESVRMKQSKFEFD